MKKITQMPNAGKAGENYKFILYFLYENEDERVHVEEVDEINFSKVIHHLHHGGSVFITQRK